ncbi:hypothetical protein D031_2212A, partial [Vibrio parahaemolyticus VP-48]
MLKHLHSTRESSIIQAIHDVYVSDLQFR